MLPVERKGVEPPPPGKSTTRRNGVPSRTTPFSWWRSPLRGAGGARDSGYGMNTRPGAAKLLVAELLLPVARSGFVAKRERLGLARVERGWRCRGHACWLRNRRVAADALACLPSADRADRPSEAANHSDCEEEGNEHRQS